MINTNRVCRALARLPYLCALICLGANVARAELRIEITQGVDTALPIAIAPFGQPWRGASEATRIDEVISADLGNSGWFRLIPKERMLTLPTPGGAIDFRDWRLLGSESLLIGTVEDGALGSYNVTFELHDVIREMRLTGARYEGVSQNDLRRLAHHIADRVFEALTGIRGVFGTRIAYITDTNGVYELAVADADGYQPIGVLTSREPMLSPAWSPNGEYLAYVAFDKGRPAIFEQELATGQRRKLASFPGINGAPAWSPDGQRLALTLSKDGNPEIYIYERSTGALRRITNNGAIDTEASWAPDARSLYFTSDRSGGPQVYRQSTNGSGEAERVTFDLGKYNARPRVSPDGSLLAFVTRSASGYNIAVRDLNTGVNRVLTDGSLDESPSFAPNGKLIIYTTTRGNKEMLAAVSVDGKIKQNLAVQRARVREPGWSPFFN